VASHGNFIDGRNGHAENDAARRGNHVINSYPYFNPPLPPVDNQLNHLEDRGLSYSNNASGLFYGSNVENNAVGALLQISVEQGGHQVM
jgi:hypothetical protein